ncbi:hypothetical protein [Spartinivicinus ruber]|uniref:hypothetical protein n=1 Tax=Spartinivicinus ruber TaxID=2683272 RepID=UPI0013D6185B|nr:hypothetical protein [Spartinivicinus ruber]
MDRRKILSTATLLVAIIGIGFAMSPFIISLNPPSHLPEYAKGFDISEMEENSIKTIHIRSSKKIEYGRGSSWEPGDALIIVRGDEKEFHLYWVPTWEQQFLMPMTFWGQHGGYCKKLGVEVNTNRRVIKCLSSESSRFPYKEWMWSIEGEGLGRMSPDLYRINFRVENNVIYAFLATNQY